MAVAVALAVLDGWTVGVGVKGWVAVARGAVEVAVAIFVGWAVGGAAVGVGETGTAVFTGVKVAVAVARTMLVAVATAVGRLVGVLVM